MAPGCPKLGQDWVTCLQLHGPGEAAPPRAGGPWQLSAKVTWELSLSFPVRGGDGVTHEGLECPRGTGRGGDSQSRGPRQSLGVTS